MTQKTNSRSFVLKPTRVYVPGSVPREEPAAKSSSGGGCCDSELTPNDGSLGCCTDAQDKQTSSCCG